MLIDQCQPSQTGRIPPRHAAVILALICLAIPGRVAAANGSGITTIGNAPDSEIVRVSQAATPTTTARAQAYALFRSYGRTEAKALWAKARGQSASHSPGAPALADYDEFRAYVKNKSRQASETFFKGRYARSRARLPENIALWRSRPDIANPGPDLANYPNSPYTLPSGRAYVEISPFSYYGSAQGTPAQYNAEFLLRYGLTDDIELRLFGNGPSWSGGANSTWGFSPIAFDTKVNLWLEKPEYFLPAGGFEAYLQTQWLGSAPFNGGTQPSLTLLFDQSLPFDIDLSYTVGATRMLDPDRSSGYDWEVSFQWALQRDFFSKDFALFIHGFYNAATLPRVPRPTQPVLANADLRQNAVGAGFIWTVNSRLALYGQASAGTTRATPQPIGLLGFAVSF